MTARRGALVAAALVLIGSEAKAQGEDSTPPVRHILAIDYSRIKAFRRSYDVSVVTADSAVPIGRRDVSLEEITTPESAGGWLLVESRAGAATSLDSVFLAADLRPTRWHSIAGGVNMEMAFTADSMRGSIRIGQASSRPAISVPPDLVFSLAGFEMIAPLLPLSETWSDTASAMAMTLAGASTEPSEMLVIGMDSVLVAPELPPRPSWVVSLRAGARESRVWVDRENGDVLRAQQLLPARVGSVLEYRMRSQLTTAP